MISHAMAQQIVKAELAAQGVRYAWVITQEADWDSDKDVMPVRRLPDDEVIEGLSGATAEELAKARTGQRFRLVDDDKQVCGVGTMWASDFPDDWTQSAACWAPMDDYGRGGYGATVLEYVRDDRWMVL
ncbi:hypothetical protein GCM10010124_02020 [Pilimelia terevasa]|uniref:Uncharacterized protein n=1 Tax=Pilimelia terevasa TaxID=53372 RepID=A0A8J3FH74_9ACTN|nr:hypothetical protein [Pilimelia terevasa]GGK13068.1 hypothetical protein GCM10010124_02020 [Pilimelia terevasa]